MLTGSASDAEALRATEPADGDALVFVGFMGAGKSSAARTVAAELGVQPLDSDRELEGELGEPLESSFSTARRAASRASRARPAAARAARRRCWRWARRGGSEAVREAPGRHTVVHLEVEPDAWRRASGKGRPLARERDRFDQLHRDRRALYEGAADAVLPPAERDTPRRAPPWRCSRRGRPCRHPARVGLGCSRRLPGIPGPRLDRVRFLPSRTAALRGDRRARGPPPSRGLREPDRGAGRRGAQVDPQRRARAPPARPGRRRARRSRGGAGGGVVGDLAASAPPSTSAGCATCRCPPR